MIRRNRVRSAVTVALVLALAGLLFSVSAELARGTEARHPDDLPQLVRSESDDVQRLTGKVDDLKAQVDSLSAAQQVNVPTGDPTMLRDAGVDAGMVAVTGSGLKVALSDAPQTGNYPPEIQPDDLVVHQQDVQSVINALWAGGAESMMLQDQRVTATTAFRCVGNVLSLGGRLYSPPFTVTAIGDPAKLRAALDASPQIQIYQQYVKAIDLGWKVSDLRHISMPAADAPPALEYATVPQGTDLYGSD